MAGTPVPADLMPFGRRASPEDGATGQRLAVEVSEAARLGLPFVPRVGVGYLAAKRNSLDVESIARGILNLSPVLGLWAVVAEALTGSEVSALAGLLPRKSMVY